MKDMDLVTVHHSGLQVVNRVGVQFNVTLEEKNEEYYELFPHAKQYETGELVVCFYDNRYFKDHNELGQFVSSYYISTFNEVDDNYGLNLDGGIDDWSISGKNIAEVKEWISSYMEQR